MRRLCLVLFTFSTLGSAQVNAFLEMLEPAKPEPLTEKQRFYDYLRTTGGILPLTTSALSSAVSHGMERPEEWGTGWSGFGKRYADSLGFNAVRNTITYASSFPLHEDNRYFASNRSTIGGRIAYALTSPVMGRHRNGRRTFSFSATAGIAGACLIEPLWSPPSWRTGGHVASSFAVTYGISAGTNLFREFVPDLLHRLRR